MDKRESLTARYERVLGRPLVDSESDDPQVEGSETRSPTTRREQVLNAQRTHRNRTQQYIRELEKEVFRLRDENDDLRHAMDQMRGQAAEMRTAIIQAGVPFNFAEVEGELTELQLQQQRQQQQEYHTSRAVSTENPGVAVDLTRLAGVPPVSTCSEHPGEIAPPVYQPSLLTAQEPINRSLFPSLQSQQPVYEHDQESVAQVGINFILALEQPCYSHVKHAHMGYATNAIPPDLPFNLGPGHLLNASAMLTHRYHDRQIEESPLRLPSSDLERLLEASARLRLDGEVTPVQIWARVRAIDQQQRQSLRGGVTEAKVGRLMDEFKKYVYCNSFGSVVQSGTVDAVLADVLGFGTDYTLL